MEASLSLTQACTEDECINLDSWVQNQPGKHPLEIECGMNKASDFSTPQRWVLSTSLLRMIKENNCILTTCIDILKWKRNEEQILGGLPLMIMDFPEWEPFWKPDSVFFIKLPRTGNPVTGVGQRSSGGNLGNCSQSERNKIALHIQSRAHLKPNKKNVCESKEGYGS